MTSALLSPLHLGGLHPFETALLALLAFGPFVVLVLVVMVVRRRDREAEPEGGGGPLPEQKGPQRRHSDH